jgi:cell division septation protein DedD
MKIKLYIITQIVFALLILNSCSSSKETQEKKQVADSLYIFDEIPPEDIFKLESPTQQSVDVYVVQIGAFSSLERARDFAAQSQSKLNREIKVEFNEKKNLYVVWIHPPFQEKSAAENYKSELWNYEEFKDAWIVTIESKK